MECIFGDLEQGRKYYQQGQEYAQNFPNNGRKVVPDESTHDRIIQEIERVYESFDKSDIEIARKLSKLVVGVRRQFAFALHCAQQGRYHRKQVPR
jgi:hypothetical protein